jgi:hypothetical protein
MFRPVKSRKSSTGRNFLTKFSKLLLCALANGYYYLDPFKLSNYQLNILFRVTYYSTIIDMIRHKIM